jgi:hypothetical protein
MHVERDPLGVSGYRVWFGWRVGSWAWKAQYGRHAFISPHQSILGSLLISIPRLSVHRRDSNEDNITHAQGTKLDNDLSSIRLVYTTTTRRAHG